MRSPKIEATGLSEAEKQRYSDMQVLSNSAGYYIGTLYRHDLRGWIPGTLESNFFYRADEAAQLLQHWEDDNYQQQELIANHRFRLKVVRRSLSEFCSDERQDYYFIDQEQALAFIQRLSHSLATEWRLFTDLGELVDSSDLAFF